MSQPGEVMTLFDFLDKYHEFFSVLIVGAFFLVGLAVAKWLDK